MVLILDINFNIIKMSRPGWVAGLVGVLSHTPKACEFDPQSGHIGRLWVGFLVGVPMEGNGSMVPSHVDVPLSLPLFLPPPFSLKKKKKRKNQ